jgi:hypothetical protein
MLILAASDKKGEGGAMRALVYAGEGRIEVSHDVTLRDPAWGEIVVRIVACGLCRSDLSVATAPSRGQPRRFWATKAPASSRRSGRASAGSGPAIMSSDLENGKLTRGVLEF